MFPILRELRLHTDFDVLELPMDQPEWKKALIEVRVSVASSRLSVN
jgi:hypothetical protein